MFVLTLTHPFQVTVYVRHTHKEVPKEDIDALLAIYGTLESESSFCMNGEFENDIYTVDITLKFLIPEFLPIRGKRARVYYHGIAPFCIVCNTPGHTKPECQNAPVPWSEYVNFLKSTGIPHRLLEPIPENSYASSSAQSKNYFTSTPKHSTTEDLLRSLFQGAFSIPQTPQPSTSKNQSEAGIDPTFSASKPRNSNSGIDPTFRPTGRGRGSTAPGKGRGKPSESFAPGPNSNFALGQNQNFGRGRGRGRGKSDPEPNLSRGRGGYNFRQFK